PLPTTNVATTPPSPQPEIAPPPTLTNSEKPAVKRPAPTARTVEAHEAHKTPTAHHRHKATETLMGQKELMNPLAQ
ncbi:MAG TPA: hypothetical protein VIA18_03110, partial [Polyangia bacterium]|nr:hypothetical protein [Polyangia bacterium]